LDFVKATDPSSRCESFWRKNAVKLLSVTLLVLVFIGIREYEQTIHDLNNQAITALPAAIVTSPLEAQKPLQEEPKPPAQPAIAQVIADQKNAPVMSGEPKAVPVVISKVRIPPVSYHWQIMASSQLSTIKAQESLGIVGLKPYVQTKQVNGKTWYTLNVGSFATKDEAQAMLNQLPPSQIKQKWWLVKTVAE
jgi:septal ring-binding cell division protein DamX